MGLVMVTDSVVGVTFTNVSVCGMFVAGYRCKPSVLNLGEQERHAMYACRRLEHGWSLPCTGTYKSNCSPPLSPHQNLNAPLQQRWIVVDFGKGKSVTQPSCHCYTLKDSVKQKLMPLESTVYRLCTQHFDILQPAQAFRTPEKGAEHK